MNAVCLWSGPRNVSTALMYSFAQRADTTVVDEPLYGHYLRVSGATHPGGEEVCHSMNCDGDAVMRALLAPKAHRRPLLFIKHMAHHLVDIDLSFLDQTRNTFLIRDPKEMLPSLRVQIPGATLADTGLKRQWELFEDMSTRGPQPAVLDSRELLLDPRTVLSEFCQRIGVAFDPQMLSWPPGPIPEDGIWAKYWYHSVHKSTGFAPYVPKDHFPNELRPLLEECQPWYDKLFAHAIKASTHKESKQ